MLTPSIAIRTLQVGRVLYQIFVWYLPNSVTPRNVYTARQAQKKLTGSTSMVTRTLVGSFVELSQVLK
jgi:hypothetical protein